MSVTRLGVAVRSMPVARRARRVSLGALDKGGYAVEFAGARTAVDVTSHEFERIRYAFVASLGPDARAEPVVDFLRRIHATHVQFYDWAYRHDDLVSPTEEYVDPLGLERSLSVVRRHAQSLRSAGMSSMGYAAVYAIPATEEDRWAHALMLNHDGMPYRLGEGFLSLTDPSDESWKSHFYGQLRHAKAEVDLDGFHLDAYGWPKFALRQDGSVIDLASALAGIVDGVADAVPHAVYMFNNVNDFPTEATATSRQHATYIEVWSPHDSYGDLAMLIDRARRGAPRRPVVLAAYLSTFDTGEPEESLESARLLMAVAGSSGGSTLLLGEDGHLLTGPYYANNHELSDQHREEFVRWYDFIVSMSDVLYDPQAVEVTEQFAGGINHDVIVVLADGSRASTKPQAGDLWLRVVRTGEGLVVHLIDLTRQHETDWDAPKLVGDAVVGARLILTGLRADATVVMSSPNFPPMSIVSAGESVSFEQSDALSAAEDGMVFELPPLDSWTVILIPWDRWVRTDLNAKMQSVAIR
ncbi:MAG: hypothetical protein KIT89_13045 [Microcella sp.]|nr:MAG: hypothetical protein KIT89_13045 [Microcella sp.]